MRLVPERTLTQKSIFQGKVVTLRVDEVLLQDGRVGRREVVEHPGAVGILAIERSAEGSGIVLVEQYRYAVGEFLWEIPAGTLKPGEDPLECAKRELREETGYTAEKWDYLIGFYTTPGFTSERMHLFLARGLAAGPQEADGDEFLSVRLVPLDRALEMLRSGQIRDAKTTIALLALGGNRALLLPQSNDRE